MKNRIKILLAVLMLLLVTVFVCSCSDESDVIPEGTVTVKYDANGGTFTTNTAVIKDSYACEDLIVNRFGKYEIPLIDPNNGIRGAANSFLASKSGYFLAGWYAKLPAVDENGNAIDEDGALVSESGKPQATALKKWDFENDTFQFDVRDYEKGEIILELVAMWIPEFTFEFYDLDTGKLLKVHSFDPMYVDGLELPTWNEETGKLDMKAFPVVDGKTYAAVYRDPHGLLRVTTDKIYHGGIIDEATATAIGSVEKLYVDMNEGHWYNIYTAEQFLDAKDLSGNYNILADLDFEEDGWIDEFMYGEFTGTIRGNGHTLKNITYYQSSASKSNAALFGSIATGAVIEDVNFENLNFVIETGSRLPGASFALFAGVLDRGAVIDNITINGKLTVAPTPYITEDTIIGLFCGTGDPGNVDISGILAEALPPESEYDSGLEISVDGNAVIIVVIPAEEE